MAEEKETKPLAKGSSEPSKTTGIVVDAKDMALLDKMSKAVEAYVFKNDKKEFKTLCQDKHFDCFVSEKPFPKGKKKINRTVPPYASGAKMGLHGEERVQVKYDFYP